MDTQRFSQRQQDFLRAAARLQEAVMQQGDSILRDATIQRFEFTFEIAWKTLQLYLLHQGMEATGPRQTLKQAFVDGLIATPEDADIWLAMLEDRNLTTHTYREAVAESIAAHIRRRYASQLHDMAVWVAKLTLD
ncbi:MAG TPA: HI0074 family nucleotidyltransferase substrate-binding subunit [Sulfuriferula sp.]|nr:HI0074 family nucleotidyltransferase substrate-binding subunit [Sulfuriferula sp.]